MAYKIPKMAIKVRNEYDTCPNCKKGGKFISYVAKNFEREYVSEDGILMQSCGFMCTRCGFSNAGERQKNGED